MNMNNNVDKSLSKDGYYDHLQPYKLSSKIKQQFNRRLWLGGSIKIHNQIENPNENVNLTMIECLDKVRNLKTKAVVTTKREIIDKTNEKLLLTEYRDIFYTNELYKYVENESVAAFNDFNSDYHSDVIVFSSDDIKQFSHITENPHFIHLDAKYNCNTEGLPERLVVQGPNLLNECIKFLLSKLGVSNVNDINYRNNAIVFEDDAVEIKLNTKAQELVLGSSEKGICLTLTYLL